uniref:Uncharacterized protein n=1 Tax=Spodoptera exigua multiple nucleopolyhedrovirus TaxID=10454 RepID=A0A6N0C2F2_9ABAC|nr:hypothetical protein [Spodoptera exigua multiple nucleopolyhedrovirus]UWK31543.1 hypothetical protein [Spodoptera exigua multiple nucleopolyhedrovirus]
MNSTNHRYADTNKQWNPIVTHKSYYSFWLTQRIPTTSLLSLPLVKRPNCAFNVVYFTERFTDLHKFKSFYKIYKIACHQCREKLKLYHYCYIHIRYDQFNDYRDFGIDELLCHFCNQYCVVHHRNNAPINAYRPSPTRMIFQSKM